MIDPKAVKFKQFKRLLPTILELCETYTYQGVVDILKEKHDFEIEVGTFRTYMARYKNERKDGNKKPITKINHDLEVKSNFDLSEKTKEMVETHSQDDLTDRLQNDVVKKDRVGIVKEALSILNDNPLNHI